jgi:polyhydroxyalkanoate synthase subunit PhaC
VSSDPAEAAKSGDKRFAAPEWHSNALYHTLKEAYLLASDWLLKHAEVVDMADVERQDKGRRFVGGAAQQVDLIATPEAFNERFVLC